MKKLNLIYLSLDWHNLYIKNLKKHHIDKKKVHQLSQNLKKISTK